MRARACMHAHVERTCAHSCLRVYTSACMQVCCVSFVLVGGETGPLHAGELQESSIKTIKKLFGKAAGGQDLLVNTHARTHTHTHTHRGAAGAQQKGGC